MPIETETQAVGTADIVTETAVITEAAQAETFGITAPVTEINSEMNTDITENEITSPAVSEITEISSFSDDITVSESVSEQYDFSETISSVGAETEITVTEFSEETLPFVSESEIFTEYVTEEITENITEEITSVTLLEEEKAETVTEAVTVIQQPQEQKSFNISDYEQPLMIAGAAFAGAVFVGIAAKSKKKNRGAKLRDSERLNSVKAQEKARREKNKKDKSRKKAVLPKTVKDTLPYKKCLPNDIWLLADKKYSKVYVIDDINYNLGDENQQEFVLESYCTFLNTLDDTAVCQVSVWNCEIDVKEHEKDILIELADDGFNSSRNEYNEAVLKANLSKGNNAIRKNIYITMTIECPDYETAVRRFNSIDLTIKNSFDHIGNTRLRS